MFVEPGHRAKQCGLIVSMVAKNQAAVRPLNNLVFVSGHHFGECRTFSEIRRPFIRG